MWRVQLFLVYILKKLRLTNIWDSGVKPITSIWKFVKNVTVKIDASSIFIVVDFLSSSPGVFRDREPCIRLGHLLGCPDLDRRTRLGLSGGRGGGTACQVQLHQWVVNLYSRLQIHSSALVFTLPDPAILVQKQLSEPLDPVHCGCSLPGSHNSENSFPYCHKHAWILGSIQSTSPFVWLKMFECLTSICPPHVIS